MVVSMSYADSMGALNSAKNFHMSIPHLSCYQISMEGRGEVGLQNVAKTPTRILACMHHWRKV